MQHLRSSGYYTALVGKHHYIDRFGLGVDVTSDDDELRSYGFDYVFQVVDDGENQHNDDEYTHYLAKKGLLEEFRSTFHEHAARFTHPFQDDDTADGFIGRNAVEYIHNYRKNAPLYLNISFVGPHPPYWHPNSRSIDPGCLDPIRGTADPVYEVQILEKRRHYLCKCSLIDRYVGEIIHVLQEKLLLENTILVFTADHGDNLGDYGIWDKRYFYEHSCGVPLFMTGPGIPRAQRMNGIRRSKALVSHIDLYPTILDIAGISYSVEQTRCGLSLIPVLLDTPGSRHDAVYSELGTSIMIHTGNWKMVFDPEQGGTIFLFNLMVDPTEETNLAGKAGYEERTRRLLERILSHKIKMTQYSHIKEEQRLQQVRIG